MNEERKAKGPPKRTIGYLRVSTQDQDLERNKADILALTNEKDLGRADWVEEEVSGTKDWRKRKLGEIIESTRSGDSSPKSFSPFSR